MRLLFFFLFVSASFASEGPQDLEEILSGFRSGDLIFVGTIDSPIGHAIAETSALRFPNAPRLSHVALIVKSKSGVYLVYEMVERGLNKVPLEAFVRRHPKGTLFYGAHWKDNLRKAARRAVKATKDYERAYDFQWSMESKGKSFCSRMVYELFKGKKGKPLFTLYPMYFGQVGSPIRRFWREHFTGPLSDGQLSLNPASIYHDAQSKGYFEKIVRFQGPGMSGP